MRVMLKAQTDAASGNRALADGTIGRLLGELTETLRPEAVYIGPQDGKRTMLFFLELKDTSEIVKITEPFFEALDAEVDVWPVMTPAEVAEAVGAS